MEAWVEAMGQAAKGFAAKALDLIEWAWQRAIAPKG
jgi:hypothetical protein